ncbi:hypothetical protein [Nostoc sp. 'Lobaria pulmonaria (5183) cyanobiont']|nr:hypothetical protein [Nostoc sp. 'Lobaria pulmonaria (5183) cyanobiont']
MGIGIGDWDWGDFSLISSHPSRDAANVANADVNDSHIEVSKSDASRS